MIDDCNGRVVTSGPGVPVRRSRANSIFSTVEQRNPILSQVEDNRVIKSFFASSEYIPFAGTTLNSGDSLLNFFMSMAELSPTHGACIEYQKVYSLGGKIDIVRSVDDVFDIDDTEDVSIELKRQFVELINSIDIGGGLDLSKLSQSLFTDYKKTGNAYFTLTLSTSLGVKSAAMHQYKPTHCRYKYEQSRAKVIAISPYWNKKYLQDNPPLEIPVFPMYQEDNGVLTTIFHLKNGADLYGRPDSLSAFMHWYREFQDAQYLIKESDNGFTGKSLIETEAGDPETDYTDDNGAFDSIADRIEDNFTNKGEDPMSIVYMERPSGARSAYVFQFSPNTNENFYKVAGTLSEDKIIRAHKWSRRLIGDSEANGFSSNVFLDELKTKLPVIIENQQIIDSPLNVALMEIVEYMERTDLLGLAIQHKSPFKHLLDEQINDKNGTDANHSVGGSQV